MVGRVSYIKYQHLYKKEPLAVKYTPPKDNNNGCLVLQLKAKN